MKRVAIPIKIQSEPLAVTAVAQAPEPEAPPQAGAVLYRVPNLCCPVEENAIRRAVDGIDGIKGLNFQFSARTLGIKASSEALPKALEAIRKAGFEPQPLVAKAHAHADGHDHDHDHEEGAGHLHDHGAGPGWLRLGAALVLALGAEVLHLFEASLPGADGLGLAVAAVAIWLSGIDTYTQGFAALRRGSLSISALMSVAVTGAFLIGQWPEAAMVMALYAIAERIEALAADRARNAIEGLLALAPERAEVLQADGSWTSLASDEVAVGAVVRVRPGERVPLDGVVTEGRSAIDQSPVTGESLPVDKALGDAVFAGTINQSGELQFRVTAAASNTTLARIIHAVEEAQSSRAPTQRFIDRFATVYTPAVFVLAAAFAIGAPLLFDVAWRDALYKALVLLVVACPCALVISTPVTVVSALASAARRGILVKGGAYLEQARSLKVLALDKTGTITAGNPVLVDWIAFGPDKDKIARQAAALASRSDHPVSKAIAAGIAVEPAGVLGFTALPGRGVQAGVEGRRLVLGNPRLIEERGHSTPDIEARCAEHERQGRSVTLLADDRGVLALFAVADTVKPSSKEAVAELRALGVLPVMLSGDNPTTARAIGAEVGIDEIQAGLLPEDKLGAIHALQQKHGPTAMAGDGINDAPALAKADIGFAMGAAGTDIAMEAADVVVMNDDLRRIAETIRLSRRTHAVLWQNISFAIGIKAVFMALAIAGSATMWMAVFADVGATLLVVANGLRLLRR